MDLPRIIGHRGAAAEAPENTLASIRRAHASGALMVEFDVKLTRDRVPILFHDDHLDRTTDGRGPVRDRTLAEIQALDAGAWFEPRFRGEPVPTLDQAVDLCVTLGLAINIEIKPCPGRGAETGAVALARLTERWPGSLPRPLVSSFDQAALAAARDAAPDWPRGYLAGPLPTDWQDRLRRFGCTTLHLGWRRLTGAQARSVADAGVPLLIYTVNDPERARRLFGWGVGAVFTDTVRSLVAAGLGPDPCGGAAQ